MGVICKKLISFKEWSILFAMFYIDLLLVCLLKICFYQFCEAKIKENKRVIICLNFNIPKKINIDKSSILFYNL